MVQVSIMPIGRLVVERASIPDLIRMRHVLHYLSISRTRNNDVKAATEAGHSVLLYGRLRNGKSTKPDLYEVPQFPFTLKCLRS